jgi:hypothetical protein
MTWHKKLSSGLFSLASGNNLPSMSLSIKFVPILFFQNRLAVLIFGNFCNGA